MNDRDSDDDVPFDANVRESRASVHVAADAVVSWNLVFAGFTAPVLMKGVVVLPRLCQSSTMRSMHRPVDDSVKPNRVIIGRVFLPEAASSQHCVGDISPCSHWVAVVAQCHCASSG